MSNLRLAGDAFDLDVKKGLQRGDIEGIRRAFRRDKMIPRSLMKDFGNSMAPENSQPEYALSGSYQPEVAYGA